MSNFEDILLQEQPIEVLRRSFEGGRIAQTYLFAGKKSVGRMQVAKAFSSLIQCSEPVKNSKGEIDACGKCENCVRVANNTHPDVKIVTPDGSEIKINQIRELQDIAVLKPTLGKWQIFILDPADKLNVSAANALLKTLEEAPAHSLFILLASDTGAVLPTVLSRSEIVRFNTPSHQQVRSILAKMFDMSENKSASCYALSEGNFGQSLLMAKNFTEEPEVVGIKQAHTSYILQLQLFGQYVENLFSSITTLDAAVAKAWQLEQMNFQPLLEARKAVCRSLFMNTGLPNAFSILFAQEVNSAINHTSDIIKKSLEPVLAENKKSYTSAILKDVENQIDAAASRWGTNELENLLLCLMNWYYDALMLASGADETLLLNLDRKEDILKVAKVEGFALLRSRIEMLERSIDLLRRYVQPLFILENVITQIGGPEA